nr:uncharacterized protein LOC109178468 [Ipomoea batatas]
MCTIATWRRGQVDGVAWIGVGIDDWCGCDCFSSNLPHSFQCFYIYIYIYTHTHTHTHIFFKYGLARSFAGHLFCSPNSPHGPRVSVHFDSPTLDEQNLYVLQGLRPEFRSMTASLAFPGEEAESRVIRLEELTAKGIDTFIGRTYQRRKKKRIGFCFCVMGDPTLAYSVAPIRGDVQTFQADIQALRTALGTMNIDLEELRVIFRQFLVGKEPVETSSSSRTTLVLNSDVVQAPATPTPTLATVVPKFTLFEFPRYDGRDDPIDVENHRPANLDIAMNLAKTYCRHQACVPRKMIPCRPSNPSQSPFVGGLTRPRQSPSVANARSHATISSPTSVTVVHRAVALHRQYSSLPVGIFADD